MSSSVIKLVCPNLQCRKILSVPAKARGKSARCRACGIRVTVPGKKKNATAPQQTEELTTDQIVDAKEKTEQKEPETV